jgi:hypothetical protein
MDRRSAQRTAHFEDKFGSGSSELVVTGATDFSMLSPGKLSTTGWCGQPLDKKNRNSFKYAVSRRLIVPRMIEAGFRFLHYKYVSHLWYKPKSAHTLQS